MTAPSTFALDYMNNVPIANQEYVTAAPKAKEIKKRKPKYEVLQGTGTKELTLTGKSLARTIVVLAVLALFLIMTVALNAHATVIKYNINKLNSQNSKIENEIRLVSTRIETANSISSLSQYAMEELGLGAPSVGQYVYLNSSDITSNLADTLKNKLYN